MTDETIQKLEKPFGMDCTVPEACLLAGIVKSTYYEYCEKTQFFRTN